MEIELKYKIESRKALEKMWQSEELSRIKDPGSEETIRMGASYFDSADRRLGREGITFRVRKENERIVATLKWNGTSRAGLHEREEINVPLPDEAAFSAPDADIFRRSPMSERVKKLLGDRKLICVMRMDFTRTQVRVDTGEAICQLSVDRGVIINGEITGEIAELEIELLSGDRYAMTEWGSSFAQKYGLAPENRSKFKQGLDLVNRAYDYRGHLKANATESFME